MAELVLKEEVYEVIGAAMEVYYRLGRGFLEPIYQEAFEIELARRGLPFEHNAELTIEYKGQTLEKKYVPRSYMLQSDCCGTESVGSTNWCGGSTTT